MASPTFTFSLVVYHAYNPPVENCRATATKGGVDLSFQRETWEELFKTLRCLYGNVQFTIPEELPVIQYDEKFNRIKS